MASPTGIAAINSFNNNGQQYVKLVEMSSPTMPDILRFCDDDVDTTSAVAGTSETYQTWPFLLPLPAEINAASDPTVTLQIDNVNRSLLRTVLAISVMEKIIVRLWVVLASTPDTAERGPIGYYLRSVEMNNPLTISMTLGREPVFDEGLPYLAFTKGSNAGLFNNGKYITGTLGGGTGEIGGGGGGIDIGG